MDKKVEMLHKGDWVNFIKFMDYELLDEGHLVIVVPIMKDKNNNILKIGVRWEYCPPYFFKDDVVRNWYTVVSGVIELGETPLQAAQREMIEETGLSNIEEVAQFKVIKEFIPVCKSTNVRVTFFEASFTDEKALWQDAKGDGTENERKSTTKWLTLPDLESVLASQNHDLYVYWMHQYIRANYTSNLKLIELEERLKEERKIFNELIENVGNQWKKKLIESIKEREKDVTIKLEALVRKVDEEIAQKSINKIEELNRQINEQKDKNKDLKQNINDLTENLNEATDELQQVAEELDEFSKNKTKEVDKLLEQNFSLEVEVNEKDAQLYAYKKLDENVSLRQHGEKLFECKSVDAVDNMIGQIDTLVVESFKPAVESHGVAYVPELDKEQSNLTEEQQQAREIAGINELKEES